MTENLDAQRTDGHLDDDALAVRALGGFTDEEERVAAAHLATCERCRAAVAQLDDLTSALGDVPPEYFLDGPPQDDLVVERAVRAVREREAEPRRTNRGLRIAAAAVAGIAILAGGVVLGRGFGSPGGTPTADPPSSSATTTVPGTVAVQASDPGTGATMDLAVVPAAGWVRLNLDVGGIPAGQNCQVVVVAADGSEVVAGSWLVSDAGEADGTVLTTFALVAPEDVAAVRVENLDGETFVVAEVA